MIGSGRISTLITIGILLLVGCGGSNRSEPRNVIFIVVDTLRADRMSLYGYERPTTPELEDFAREAVVFDRAYSPSAWTRASVASYLTGLYPSSHGCETPDDVLDRSHATLAELFRARGFTTAGIHANRNISATFGFDQGFDIYEHAENNAGYPGDHQVADAASVNDMALRWLREARPETPWFLFLLYMDPHDPYLPHPEHWFGPAHPEEFFEGSRSNLKLLEGTSPVDENRQRRVIRDLYDGEIAYVDRHLGQLFDQLEAMGLDDDTVVVVTSDHGEGLWDHAQYRSHGRYVYEEAIHVPLVVRWPGITDRGSRRQHPVQAFGMFGTLAEAFELAPSEAYQAPSLLGALGGLDVPQDVFVEQRANINELRAWIDWPIKLIRNDTLDQDEFYDLQTNPSERRVVDSPPAPGQLSRYRAAVDSATAENANWKSGLVLEDGPAEPTEADIEALKALGYID